MTENNDDNAMLADDNALVQEPRLWQGNGWTARVIKNEDDEGWAVAMSLDGEPEPALVGPWTMGRDKKNPKPLDMAAFLTLVKTAKEVVRRHEQHLHATLHKQVYTDDFKVTLDIVPDDEHPYALLAAWGDGGERIAQSRVGAGFRLTESSANAWIANGFRVDED